MSSQIVKEGPYDYMTVADLKAWLADKQDDQPVFAVNSAELDQLRSIIKTEDAQSLADQWPADAEEDVYFDETCLFLIFY